MSRYKIEDEQNLFLIKQKPEVLIQSDEKLSNDDLRYKGINMETSKSLKRAPNDKFKIIFLIFILHGLGTLMPWNMFITAKNYFVDFKLGETNSTDSSNYATNFLQYIGFASQIPNLVFNWLNVFVNMGGELTKRVVYSILIEIFIFIITIILAMLDSSSWPGTFFWITMISVVILNMANGVYQNTIYGMVAALPIKYTGAVVLGSNISGLFASIISIFSNYMFSTPRRAAIYYFITAMWVLLVCFDTYFALPLNRFFRFYDTSKQKCVEKKESQKDPVPYVTIFKKAFPQLFNIFLTFFVTLSIFPAIHSDIKPTDENFVISPNLFTSVTCYLTFNFFAMLGSLATSWIKWPKPGYLFIPVSLRIIFIPLFLFCNYSPKGIIRSLPVLISNEWAYWIIAIIMSFSSGYLSSLGMMYVPETVPSNNQVTAGMFAAAMLITGIFSGILFSFVFPSLVANISF